MSEPHNDRTKHEHDDPTGSPADQVPGDSAAAAPQREPVPVASPDDEADPDTPFGAIAVTGFLAAVILVLWFAMYALNLARS
ncbi:MAG: cytochrome c oxidase subunit 2A [Trueperaceae bacterium]